jgi:beta-ribofuranosylaminobenzene 5'-phosphate synthase
MKGMAPSIEEWWIRCPARLHCGLLEIAPGQPHLYGGLGMMIESPAIEISLFLGAPPAEEVDGPLSLPAVVAALPAGEAESLRPTLAGPASASPELSERMAAFLQRRFAAEASRAIVSRQPQSSPRSLQLILRQDIRPHTGLGSGTQLACGLASLLQAAATGALHPGRGVLEAQSLWSQEADTAAGMGRGKPLARLAESSERGLRSYIGLAGHLQGGLLVDYGQQPGGLRVGRLERYPMPADWRVVLITPAADLLISGERERGFFESCAQPNPGRDLMLQLIDDEVVPAVKSADFPRYAAALARFGRLGGKLFQSVQGGLFRDPQVETWIQLLERHGYLAVAQSSWGPTLFAVVPSQQQALALMAWLPKAGGPPAQFHLTSFCNHGAMLGVR